VTFSAKLKTNKFSTKSVRALMCCFWSGVCTQLNRLVKVKEMLWSGAFLTIVSEVLKQRHTTLVIDLKRKIITQVVP